MGIFTKLKDFAIKNPVEDPKGGLVQVPETIQLPTPFPETEKHTVLGVLSTKFGSADPEILNRLESLFSDLAVITDDNSWKALKKLSEVSNRYNLTDIIPVKRNGGATERMSLRDRLLELLEPPVVVPAAPEKSELPDASAFVPDAEAISSAGVVNISLSIIELNLSNVPADIKLITDDDESPLIPETTIEATIDPTDSSLNELENSEVESRTIELSDHQLEFNRILDGVLKQLEVVSDSDMDATLVYDLALFAPFFNLNHEADGYYNLLLGKPDIGYNLLGKSKEMYTLTEFLETVSKSVKSVNTGKMDINDFKVFLQNSTDSVLESCKKLDFEKDGNVDGDSVDTGEALFNQMRIILAKLKGEPIPVIEVVATGGLSVSESTSEATTESPESISTEEVEVVEIPNNNLEIIRPLTQGEIPARLEQIRDVDEELFNILQYGLRISEIIKCDDELVKKLLEKFTQAKEVNKKACDYLIRCWEGFAAGKNVKINENSRRNITNVITTPFDENKNTLITIIETFEISKINI